MIIDKASKNVLDTLIAGTPDYGGGIFTYEHIRQITGLDEDDVLRIVKDMESEKLVELARYSSGDDFGAVFTQRGAKYKEIKTLEACERWKERAWGFLTGAVLTALAWLFTSL